MRQSRFYILKDSCYTNKRFLYKLQKLLVLLFRLSVKEHLLFLNFVRILFTKGMGSVVRLCTNLNDLKKLILFMKS